MTMVHNGLTACCSFASTNYIHVLILLTKINNTLSNKVGANAKAGNGRYYYKIKYYCMTHNKSK